MADLACSVHAPIQLVSWGNIARLSHLLSRDGVDWVLMKADHEAAYKQLPIGPRDQRRAIVSLRHPRTHIWHGFVTRTLIFGSVAAVLHYNVFSRIVVALINRIFGLPLVGYFDDFSAFIRKLLGVDALRVFARACHLMGITLKPGKSAVGS